MAKEELKIAGMKLLIEGGAQFAADLNTAATKSKSLSAELKLLEAGTTTAGKNGVEFLRAKTEALSAQLVNQEQKTKILRIALQDAASATEVDAKQVAKLEAEVLKSQIAEEKLKVSLVNVSTQLEKATNSALQHGIAQKEMGEKAQAAGKKISDTGDNMTKYLTVPALAASAALAALIVNSVATADSIQQTADVTGLSTDRIQELTYAGKDLDVELEVMTKSMAKQIKSQKSAQDGTALTVDAYKKLGVEYKNSDGSLRDSETVYWEVIESLGNMTNETERDAIAMQLMGKSAMELNPLIKAGKDRIAELSAEAHDMGAVMSGKSIADLDAFGDAIEKAKVSIGTAAGEIAVEMLPTLNKLLPIVQKDIVPAIGKFAKGVGNLIVGFSKMDPVSKGIVTTLAGLVVVAGPLLKMVGTGITLFGTINGALAAHKIALATSATAAEGLAAAEGTATVAGAGLITTIGPLVIAAAAIATAITVDINLYKDMTAETTALKNETDTLLSSIKDSDAAYQDQIKSAETSATVTKKLSDELFSLSEKETKTNTEKLRMVQIVDQLNDSMPDLNLSIDKQTGALNKTKKAVDELVDSKLKELKLQASEKRLVTIYEDQLAVTEELAKAVGIYNDKVAMKNQATVDALKGDIAAAGALLVLNGEVSSAEKSVEKLTNKQSELTEQAKTLEDGYGDLAGAVVDANGEIITSAQEVTPEMQAELDAQKQAREEFNAQYEQLVSDHLNQLGALEDEGLERSKLTAEKALENRQGQMEDWQDWHDGLVSLAAKIPKNVYDELEKMGPEQDQIIDDLKNMSPEALEAWIAAWIAPAQKISNAVAAELRIPNISAGRMGMPYNIPGYAVGTHYLPKDGLIFAHEGEAIIPKAENPYINPAISLGSIATNRALTNYAAASSVVNNSTTNAPVTISLAGANLSVREEADINKIATLLAAKVTASRKAVGA